MDQFALIRYDHLREGLSIRQLANKYKVHRRTVRQALASPEPPARKKAYRKSPKMDPYKATVDQWLIDDLSAPRKQRHTATRIHQRLCDEFGATDLKYDTVKVYVRLRRPEILAAQEKPADEVMIVAEHTPGQDSQVDFGESQVIIGGVEQKAHLFHFRLSNSGKAVHRGYPTEAQEAFLAGHVDTIKVIGGVPAMIRYDNLTPAVVKVLQGRSREENDRWKLFCSYYGINPFYCKPGLSGAHEKGGIEGEVRRFRNTYLVPVPSFDSWEEFNEYLAECDRKDDQRRIEQRPNTVGEDFALEAPYLLEVPAEPFDPATVLSATVSKAALVSVRKVKYSVPARFVDTRVRVELGAFEVKIFSGANLIARHDRCTTQGATIITLDHYLEVLYRKPGALPSSKALAQARKDGVFTDAHQAYWDLARTKLSDAEATKALIDVLMLHRQMEAEHVIAGIQAALATGTINVDVVAIEARNWAGLDRATNPDTSGAQSAEIIALESRRRGLPLQRPQLPVDNRPTPDLTKWDALLTQSTRNTSETLMEASA